MKNHRLRRWVSFYCLLIPLGLCISKLNSGIDKLSKAEMKVIDGVVEKYGNWNRWTLIDEVMHKLPEWEDPNGSSRPISLKKMMLALGKSEDEINAALEENGLFERELA